MPFDALVLDLDGVIYRPTYRFASYWEREYHKGATLITDSLCSQRQGDKLKRASWLRGSR